MATCLGVIIQLYVILKNRERKDLSSILPKMIDACIWVEDETNIYCNFVRPWLKMINACKKADLVLLISIKHNLLKRNLCQFIVLFCCRKDISGKRFIQSLFSNVVQLQVCSSSLSFLWSRVRGNCLAANCR